MFVIIFHGTAEETMQDRAIPDATSKEMLEMMETLSAAASG